MNKIDLEFIDTLLMKAKVLRLQHAGVRFVKKKAPWDYISIGPDVEIGAGTIIFPNVVLLGKTIIGKNCEIEEGVRLEDVEIGDDSRLHTASRISQTRIGKKCQIWGARMYHSLIKDEVIVHSPSRIVWSEIGENCDIDSYCLIKYASIGARCKIGPHAIIEGEKFSEEILATGKRSINIGHSCHIGAQAHIHDWAVINPEAEIAHCEIVRSSIGENTRIKHCSYIGDVKMGRDANIGAGTVFGNYDGNEKYECEVGNDAFLGIHCSIVSKSTRKIGEEAFVAAHTLVTEEVKPNTLIIREVGKQKAIKWSRRIAGIWEFIQMLPSLKPNKNARS
jgi:bifunctional N-acetylglucosamine-1-phosphate-uridyltransferase/glucosamine-1-phosphate-acetyltransferase GlmU-like protein